MRVLQVVVRFHPYLGGVEQTVYQLSRRLVQRGDAVHVVCAAEPEDAPDRVDGITVERLPYRLKVGNTNLAQGLVRALRQTRADVIHTHMPTAWFADRAAAVSRALSVPLVLTYNNDLIGSGAKGLLARLYNRLFLPRLLSAATRIVTPNPLYPSLSPYLSKYAEATTSIPWGVDEERFRPAELPRSDSITLCFLSLLDAHHRYKGLGQLLRALGRLRNRGLRIRLRVGGSGELLPEYRELAARLGIAEAVEFLGFVPENELPSFFHSGHLFALPSTDWRQEGFGLVLLEAMASGRPVLTSTVVGMAAAIEEHAAGLLVPPDDIDALAAAIESTAADRRGLEGLAERGLRMVEQGFTWNRVTDAYQALFADIVHP